MAEQGVAPVADTKTLKISINANLECQPRDGHVDNPNKLDPPNGGQVYFHVDSSLKDGCRIHTSPPYKSNGLAFQGESSDGYITLLPGDNGPFYPDVEDQAITYCTCKQNEQCDPFGPREQNGNTIGVGQTERPGSH